MEGKYAIDKLQALNLNPALIPAFELTQFVDLVSIIKDDDYDQALNFVMTREKLADKPAMDKFKYLCGYLQKIKKIYQYQKNYAKPRLD